MSLTLPLPPSVRPRRVPTIVTRLIGTPLNAAITLAYVVLLGLVVWPALRWATVDATFIGTRAACDARGGACWAFLVEKFRFLIFALYPREADWQAGAAALMVVALVVASAVPRFWGRRLIGVWFAVVALAVATMGGRIGGHPVSTQQWGGLPLTVLLSVVGFVAAFPLGIALALGRRSRMGLVRVGSIVVIEGLRGVPLIAVLYVSTLIFPLMLPAGAAIDKLLRAQIAIVLFAAAYMAEIVRTGLQSVPQGQYEAATALGLRWWPTMRLVVLPQALRIAIPSFVNLGIGLFLDTTLVSIIGLFDFLNTARVAATDPNWLGFYDEAFAFTAVIYFAVAAVGSRYSLWLEKRLAVGRR